MRQMFQTAFFFVSADVTSDEHACHYSVCMIGCHEHSLPVLTADHFPSLFAAAAGGALREVLQSGHTRARAGQLEHRQQVRSIYIPSALLHPQIHLIVTGTPLP